MERASCAGINFSQTSGYGHISFQGGFIAVAHRDAENNVIQRLSTGYNWAVWKTSIPTCIFPLGFAITPGICQV